MRLLPDPMLDIRNRLFAYDEDSIQREKRIPFFVRAPLQIFEMTDETPESFRQLVPFLHVRLSRAHSLSPQNRVLLVLL